MKILVVHRQKDVQQKVKLVLAHTALSIRFYESGLDGLLAAKIEVFDLVICGTDLPVITGFELIRAIRMNSVNVQTPVVFLADEINEKMTKLSNSLGVAVLVENKKMNNNFGESIEKAIIHAGQ
jgi:DNA-binding response OmpR family regulator